MASLASRPTFQPCVSRRAAAGQRPRILVCRASQQQTQAVDEAGLTRRSMLAQTGALCLAAVAAGQARPAAAGALTVTAHSPYVGGPNEVVFTKPTAEIVKVADAWPIWEHGVDRFPYKYDEDEDCLILAGEVVVTPKGGQPVTIRGGDYVTFPAGMECVWDIRKPIRKHYKEYK